MYKVGDEVAYINNVLRYSKVVKVLTATMGMSEYKLENGKWVWEMYLIPSPLNDCKQCERLREVVKAYRKLNMCYRLGTQKGADKALDIIEKAKIDRVID